MSFLPAPLGDEAAGLTARQLARAKRAQASADLEVFRYDLAARARSQMDQADSQAIADAARVALDEEMDLLSYGMSKAGQSAARLELVARKVDLMANANTRRIVHRFGG